MDEKEKNLIWFLKDWKKKVQERRRKHKAFHEIMQDELPQVCISYFPELESCWDEWTKLLVDDIQYHCSLLLETNDMISSPYFDLPQVPTVEANTFRTEEEIQALINEMLTKYDQKNHQMIQESFRKLYEFENCATEFTSLVDKKIKEIVFQIYPEIVDYTGDQLRVLNSATYLFANEFKESLLYKANKYIIRLQELGLLEQSLNS